MGDDTFVDGKTQIVDCGQLSRVDWGGPVSARKLLSGRHGLLLNEAVKQLDDFYVMTDPQAPTRCIDGRHDPKQDELSLGPQVPGGAPGAALAYRMGVAIADIDRSTFLADAERMIERYLQLGLAPGGHRDDHSSGEFVGCGAIDRLDKIVATLVDPSLVAEHVRLVKLLLGDDFFVSDYLRILGAAVTLNAHASEYFEDRQKIIDILEARVPHSVATLEGTHQECLVAVNFVPNTTLSSNRFSAAFEGMQVFGYDIWRSKQIAAMMMPEKRLEKERENYVLARVMTSIATFMALTDGSQRLILRIPTTSNSLQN